MADSTKDILKADPIATLTAASKLSLQGGGILLFVAIVAVYKVNTDPKWHIDFWLILTLVVGAILLGLIGTLARMYDAKLRVQLSLKLIDVKGTADAEKADKLPPIIKQVLATPLVSYMMAPSPTTPLAGQEAAKD